MRPSASRCRPADRPAHSAARYGSSPAGKGKASAASQARVRFSYSEVSFPPRRVRHPWDMDAGGYFKWYDFHK
jgi:hypothetical protein